MSGQGAIIHPGLISFALKPSRTLESAKFARGLIQRIYQHAAQEGWLKPGDTCLDPFAGTGLGGMDAAMMRVQWLGVELEQRFCDLANGFDCDGQVQEALIGTYTPAVPASLQYWLSDGVNRWGSDGLVEFMGEPMRGFRTSADAEAWRDAHPDEFTLSDEAKMHVPAGYIPPITIVEEGEGGHPAYLTFGWTVTAPAPCGQKVTHEPHHVTGNLELWQRRYSHLPQWRRPTVLQGDSRMLASILAEKTQCSISSPPYAGNDKHDYRISDDGGRDRDLRRGYRQGLGCFRGSETYGQTEGNLGHLPTGTPPAALVLSRPPYSDALTHGGQRHKPGFTQGQTQGTDAFAGGDGQTPGQLESLPPGTPPAALPRPTPEPPAVTEAVEAGYRLLVSSPPYAEALSGDSNLTERDREHVRARGRNPDSPGQQYPRTYGTDPRNLGRLPPGEVAAVVDGVVASPPYANGCTQQGHDYHPERMVGTRTGYIQSDHANYGTAEGQLGTASPDTFWGSARTILEQVYQVLRPGAHAIWVVKSYCRDGAIVDFPDQWTQLCSSVGFQLVHEHRALLVEDHGTQGLLFGTAMDIATSIADDTAVPSDTRTFIGKRVTTKRASFFRRLAEKKRPDLAIDWECVLCMVKPAAAEDGGEAVACCVASPPWQESIAGGDGVAEKHNWFRDRLTEGGKDGQSVNSNYGTHPAQLGALPPGSLAAVISSPPWQDQEPSHAQADTPSSKRLRAEPASTRGQTFLSSTYGTSVGQLGQMPPGSPPPTHEEP